MAAALGRLERVGRQRGVAAPWIRISTGCCASAGSVMAKPATVNTAATAAFVIERVFTAQNSFSFRDARHDMNCQLPVQLRQAFEILYEGRAASRGRAGYEERVAMRMSVLIIMAVGMWLAAQSANAQKYDPSYPVCMHVYTGGPRGGGSDHFDCTFTSLEQCRATASGLSATCDVNPYYRLDRPPAPYRRSRRDY